MVLGLLGLIAITTAAAVIEALALPPKEDHTVPTALSVVLDETIVITTLFSTELSSNLALVADVEACLGDLAEDLMAITTTGFLDTTTAAAAAVVHRSGLDHKGLNFSNDLPPKWAMASKTCSQQIAT